MFRIYTTANLDPILFILFMKNLSLNQYLLGDNPKLIGTILAFRKSPIRSEYLEYVDNVRYNEKTKFYSPESYSVMMYFDHRLGKITRYLFNPNLMFWGKKPNIENIYTNDDNYIERGEAKAHITNIPSRVFDPNEEREPEMPIYKYNTDVDDRTPTIFIDHTLRPYLNEYNLKKEFKLLFDGKIKSRMIQLFLHQLIGNYILRGYNYTESFDMEYIYNTGLPGLNIVPMIEYPETDSVIYYPKSIKLSPSITEGVELHGITLEQRENRDHPQVIKDLKTFINGSTIQNKKFLDNRITRFNESVERFYLKSKN